MTNQEEREIVERIRSSYEIQPRTPSKLDELKALDKKVKTPAVTFAYTYGTAGSLVLGTGMCFAMKILGSSIAALMPVGIVIGLVGIAMVSTTYPLYQILLSKRKAKYSDEIVRKSNALLNKEGEN